MKATGIFDEPEDKGILARLAMQEPANYMSIVMRLGGGLCGCMEWT